MTEWEAKLEILKNEDLTNAKNVKDICCSLFDIVDNQPDLAAQVLDAVEKVLNNSSNNSLVPPYIVLGKIAHVSDDLQEKVLDLYQKALQDKDNNEHSLAVAAQTLAAFSDPSPFYLTDYLHSENTDIEIHNTRQRRFKRSSRHCQQSKRKNVVDSYAVLVHKRLKLAVALVNSPQNGAKSLFSVCELVKSILNKHLEQSIGDNINTDYKLDTALLYYIVGKTIKNSQNDPDVARSALFILSRIADTDYSLIENIYNSALQAADNLNKSGIDYAYPQSFFDMMDMYIKKYPDRYKTVINELIRRNVIHNIYNDDGRLELLDMEPQLHFLLKGMKGCKLEDFAAQNEQKLILQTVYKMRFSTQDEFSYICYNYEFEKIAQMNLSAQQRCMNIMMGQLGKEQNLPPEDIKQYRKDAKNNTTYQSNKDWLIPASINAANIFGCYFPSYIKSTEKHLSTHDAVFWLPKNLPENKRESFRSFIQRNLLYDDINGKKQVRPLSEIALISRNWEHLKPEEEKQKYKDILAICQSRKYADQEYDAFAIEAAKWGVNEGQYKDWEDVYQAGLNVPEPFDSSKEFKFGKYTGKFLPREDVRTGFFGGYTDCCQHFDGVGGSCAISTIKDPYSQLFVIENDKGRIVAGSWVWENTEGKYRDVCFDNIEAIGEYAHNQLINKIYDMAGRYLTEEANCHKVTIGLGWQDADISQYKETEPIPLPKQYDNKYSDAKKTQVLLSENPKAKPLDKTQESPRFIRDVCFLDIDEMEKISEYCFPEGDQQLQTPDRMSGLVLVDANKGVVGYCLYDKEEKSIYDMAVFPEYRKDKNASSQKLFGEMIRRIRKIGGEWSAELRDKTTYKYLDIMSKRGLVTFESHGIDHEMSDGSKVYSVTFHVPQQVKTLSQAANSKAHEGR